MAIDLNCDWKAGFVMDPTKKGRVGYLVSLGGMDCGAFLQDITVFSPVGIDPPNYAKAKLEAGTEGHSAKQIKVVGVIESFNFGGGVGDPVCISAYISSKNANTLSAKLATTLKNTVVNNLSWWICNFDEEGKQWFEEAYPKAPDVVAGQLNAPGGKDLRLVVAAEPTKVAANIDTNVFNVYFEIVPAADKVYAFQFASTAKMPFCRSWGLAVGDNAAAAVSAAG
jgi:hypothetical protein